MNLTADGADRNRPPTIVVDRTEDSNGRPRLDHLIVRTAREATHHHPPPNHPKH